MRMAVSILLCGIVAAPLPVSAHHNFAAHYRGDETIELSGVVKEFRFINPHARVYIEVENDRGEIEQWMAEGDASVALRRSGWVPDQRALCSAALQPVPCSDLQRTATMGVGCAGER